MKTVDSIKQITLGVIFDLNKLKFMKTCGLEESFRLNKLKDTFLKKSDSVRGMFAYAKWDNSEWVSRCESKINK